MWTQQLKISLGMYETQNPKCNELSGKISYHLIKKPF